MKKKELHILKKKLQGELYYDKSTRIIYATDASVYKALPLAVAFPKDDRDIITLTIFAKEHSITLIPRAAGTSLAGQTVGDGIIVDIGKHFNRIIEINEKECYAIVQPGVVRDELNREAAKKGLFFAPETATSNRCRIGGMCGNNSCGANSLLYGSTRQHILSLKTILSDGSAAEFSAIDSSTFQQKCEQADFEGKIYRSVYQLLNDKNRQATIRQGFPNPDIKRRSMGYAIDELIMMQPFTAGTIPFNFCSLLTGSEGTLAITTEIKVKLTPLPGACKALISVETGQIEDAFQANLSVLPHHPASVELIDKLILDLAKQNVTQNKNRFFITGDPAAILIVEVVEKDEAALKAKTEAIVSTIHSTRPATCVNIITGKDMEKVWALRKAGLGILSNVKGDAKPVTVVEDIAILPSDYLQFYTSFKQLLDKYGLYCAFYAHISTGELHCKPIFNLKDREEVEKFRLFARDTALLVKKHGGVLSGEHGDGRLRGEFLPLMIGEENYHYCQTIKRIFDPDNLFNAGKIVDTPPMNRHLRYEVSPTLSHTDIYESAYRIKTMFDFSDTDGILRAIEKCNGSADCKKSHLFDGGMCPSYRATHNEKDSTRARANLLREFITHSAHRHPFNHKEIKEAFDLCLACKACKSECPSNVDMTKLRAEFLYHYQQQHPASLRTLAIANYPLLNTWMMPLSSLYNFVINHKTTSFIIKAMLHFSSQRSLPTLAPYRLTKWAKKNIATPSLPTKTVYLFVDEFTDTQDVAIGITAIQLLEALNYRVIIIKHPFSGRTYLSKGRLNMAKALATQNVLLFSPLITEQTPLIGIEPSAILSFRDEYPQLVDDRYKDKAKLLAHSCLLIDEFIAKEYQEGRINQNLFTKEEQHIVFHAHCYQKALSDSQCSITMMQIPVNYHVTEIGNGCCGMAGAFGYEKEHYAMSMEIGELSLFPSIRKRKPNTLVAATGTSCRHQIKDGTGEQALHPLEILYRALAADRQKKR